MPDALHRLVGSVTDTYTVAREHPRPGDIRPSVWEIHAPGGERWFAKVHAGPKLHAREVNAYRKWTVSLKTGRAPELLASDAESRTVLLTAVAGHSLDTLRLPTEQERKAYGQAGELLSRQHAAAAAEPGADVPQEQWDETVARLLHSAAPYMPEHESSVARALLGEAPPRLPQVAGHGDYMPKNWMWDEAEQLLRIIDFERAEMQPACRRDLSRLRYRVLVQHPDLDAAFHHGYGRPLSEEELAACRVYGALDAVDSLTWGVQHHDRGLVDEAHTMLDNLRLEHPGRVWSGWRA
ncbi:aminoglycoside phosphotransferase family protein [Streptomyces sp. NPDC002520]